MKVTEKVDALWKRWQGKNQIAARMAEGLYDKSPVAETDRTFDCSTCNPKKCCYTAPLLSLYDAARLMDAGLGEYLEGSLELEKKDRNRLHIKKDGAACAFLKDGKCAHYDLRPTLCRAYPYKTVAKEPVENEDGEELSLSYSDIDEKVEFDDALCMVRHGKVDIEAVQKAQQLLEFEMVRTIMLLKDYRKDLKKTALGKFLD